MRERFAPERFTPLEDLLRRVDLEAPIFSEDERRALSEDEWESLVAPGLVLAGENATWADCDDCPEVHRELVEWIEDSSGEPPRPYVPCPDLEWVAVDPERLRQWAIAVPRLVAMLAEALLCAGRVEELVPGRLWMLGRTVVAGRTREVFFGRRLNQADGATVVGACARFQAAVGAVVLVAGVVPLPATWSGDAPPVLTLPSFVALADGALSIDRAYLESALGGERQRKARAPTRSFPAPAAAAWDEVQLVVRELDLDVVLRRKRVTFTFAEAGFEDERRSGVPDQIWKLLRVFAHRKGGVPFDDENLSKKELGNLKTLVAELRRRLRALVQIADDPFRPARGSRRYEARFMVSSTESVVLPTPAGADWEDLTIREVEDGRVEFAFATTARAASYSGSRDGDGGELDFAEKKDTVERTYDLVTLGLADRDGAPTPAGAALQAVLRASGKVARPAEDAGMLDLAGVLTQVAQIPATSPFAFDERRGRWIARFEATSALASASR